jgi:hypothetical protein
VTAAIRTRRAIRGRLRPAVLAVPLLVMTAWHGGLPPAVGADSLESPNLLDRPMADVAILSAPDGQTTPMLLVLYASSPSPSTARVAVLRRNDRWVQAASTDIDLGADGLAARWFVDLGEGRFALIATSPQSATGTGRAVVVGFAIDIQGGAVRIDELNRQAFDRAIEDAGAADVDGFGSAELVLGMRPIDSLDSCGTSTLVVVDGTITAVRRSIDIPGPRGSGVLGRFDAEPGAELLVYASHGCLPGGDFRSSLLAIRLADGSELRPVADVRHDFVTTLPPPLLVDLDGSAPDEVIATGEAGLTVFDPSTGWRSLVVAEGGSVPLVVGPSGQPKLAGVRVAILEPFGGGFLTARLRRDEGSVVFSGRSEVPIDAMDPLRWSILSDAIETAGAHQAAPNAWIGDAFVTGCQDVFLPGVIVPCGTDESRSGPAWLATRPIAALAIGSQRQILVAAGLDWRPETGLPASPTPAAAGPLGWWRHGPSAAFALSEISVDELARFDAFPKPTATIETTTAADGITQLAGSTGTRFFATMVPVAEGQVRRLPNTDPFLALTTRPVSGGRRAVVRVPVPPGAGSGRARSSASLRIGDLLLPGDQRLGGWAIRVVPINDLGQWGQPVAGTITLDDVGPTVEVEEPFTSPIWPFVADIDGRSEPGTTVRIDGIGDFEVDARGGFTIKTQLAPWPQAFRVTATDPAGNQTVGTFSIVGGIDYRRFPWPGIVAVGLLALVAARWLLGGERRAVTGIGPAPRGSGAIEDPLMPVIEELPPESGLGRR